MSDREKGAGSDQTQLPESDSMPAESAAIVADSAQHSRYEVSLDPLRIPEPPPWGSEDWPVSFAVIHPFEWMLVYWWQDAPEHREWVTNFARKLDRALNPRPAPPMVPATEVGAGRLAKSAAAALVDETRKVWSATEGSRNSTLFSAAANLRRFIRAGVLRESDVTDRLIWAGTHTGLTERECRQTIQSGYRRDDEQHGGEVLTLREREGYGPGYQLSEES